MTNKKRLFLMLSTIIVITVIVKNMLSIDANIDVTTSNSIETSDDQVLQKVNTTSSSIKKPLKINANLKVNITATNSEKNLIIEKLLEKMSPQKLNETFKVSFGKILNKEKEERKNEILKFIQDFPFQERLKEAYSELSMDELEAILAIQEHETSQKLEAKQVENQEKFMDYFNKKKQFELTEDKRVVVDQIMEESNLMERAQSSSQTIIEAAVAYTNMKKDKSLSANEARFEARKVAKHVLNSQKSNMAMAFDISYDNLTYEELQDHLRLLQRHDAKKAYEATMRAGNTVYTEFVLELLKRIKL